MASIRLVAFFFLFSLICQCAESDTYWRSCSRNSSVALYPSMGHTGQVNAYARNSSVIFIAYRLIKTKWIVSLAHTNSFRRRMAVKNGYGRRHHIGMDWKKAKATREKKKINIRIDRAWVGRAACYFGYCAPHIMYENTARRRENVCRSE